jgi:hypothetical protein
MAVRESPAAPMTPATAGTPATPRSLREKARSALDGHLSRIVQDADIHAKEEVSVGALTMLSRGESPRKAKTGADANRRKSPRSGVAKSRARGGTAGVQKSTASPRCIARVFGLPVDVAGLPPNASLYRLLYRWMTADHTGSRTEDAESRVETLLPSLPNPGVQSELTLMTHPRRADPPATAAEMDAEVGSGEPDATNIATHVAHARAVQNWHHGQYMHRLQRFKTRLSLLLRAAEAHKQRQSALRLRQQQMLSQ